MFDARDKAINSMKDLSELSRQALSAAIRTGTVDGGNADRPPRTSAIVSRFQRSRANIATAVAATEELTLEWPTA